MEAVELGCEIVKIADVRTLLKITDDGNALLFKTPPRPLNRVYNSVENYYWRKKDEKRRRQELAREGRENQAKQKVFDDAAALGANIKKR